VAKPKTGHVVGIDPVTDRIVVLRKGLDGRTVRQVDVLTEGEADTLQDDLERALAALRLRRAGLPNALHVEAVTPTPEPEQTMLDLDSLTREDGN
jgi:topoisomerase IA-like protein